MANNIELQSGVSEFAGDGEIMPLTLEQMPITQPQPSYDIGLASGIRPDNRVKTTDLMITHDIPMHGNQFSGLSAATGSGQAVRWDELGTMGTQNANNVAITGGSVTNVTITNSTIGLTSLPVHDCVYHDQITIDQQNATGASLWPMGNVTGNTAIGQVYPSGVSKQLTHCEFVITRVGNPTDAVYVSLLNTTAGAPSGASRINSDLLQARDIQDGVVNSFYFPRYAPSSNTGNWQLSGTSYAIALFRTGAVDANNYYNISYDNGGQGTAYLYNGSAWGSPFGAFVFTTYYGETTQTNIALSQLDPSNGILNVQNLGTGTLTSGAVLTVPASGNVPAWSTSLTLTGLTLGGVVITATGTELNFTDGVTSAIQTQLDARVTYTGATADLALATRNITQTTGIITTRGVNINNASNAFTAQIRSVVTANRAVLFPDYDGSVLLSTQVILESENASTNPYTISANVTQVYGTYAGTATVNIPANAPANKVYIISCGSGSTVVLTPPGGETIDGLATLWLYPNDAAIIIKTGSDWRVASFREQTTTIVRGGTGAATAANARTNLGLVIGTDVLAYSASTGTGDIVRANTPTLVTPVLGTPTSGTLTNCTGLPIATGVSGLGTGVATFLATPSSANLITVVTDETGTGALVFGTSPTIATPTFTGNIAQTTGTTFTNTATLNSSTNIRIESISDGDYYISARGFKSGGISGYTARKQITITGSSDGSSTNRRLKFTVYRSAGTDSGLSVYVGASGCQADYDDIRFTQSDGTTLLDYWIETSDASSASIWVEFNSIPASPSTATFYLYYGNASASAVSSLVNTFDFADDFDGDLSKWTGDTAKCVVSGSEVVLTPTDGDDNLFGSTASSGTKVRIRAYAYLSTGYRCHLGGAESSTPKYGAIFQFGEASPPDNERLRTYNVSATNLTVNYTRDAYKTWEMRFDANTNFKAYENDVLLGTVSTTLPNNVLNCWIGGGTGTGGTGTIKVGWIFRDDNWTANDPTVTTWGTEETFGLVERKVIRGIDGEAANISMQVQIGDVTNADNSIVLCGSRLGLYGVTPVVRSTGWAITNKTSDKVLDCDSTTTAELADVLGTLIDDLKSVGALGA